MDFEKNSVSRRDFLNAAAIGGAVLAAGSVFKILAKEETVTGALKIYVCNVCGHVEFGVAPDKCPVCHVSKDHFMPNNSLFTDAIAKTKDGDVKHVPVITVKKESALIPEAPCKEISIRVGKTIHPMEEAHQIKYLDWYMDDKFVNRIFLPLSLYPAASFYVKISGAKVRVVAWCNVHGYWQSESVIA